MALPEPECGLVISYSYLWKHESGSGQTEGLKDRPCAIVLAIDSKDTNAKTVTVAQSWSRKFGQGLKWRFCSPAA